jgi:hypothetical protein
MAVDRKFWSNDTFIEEYITPWPCPTCQHGVLVLKKDSLNEEPTGKSIRCQKNDHWEPDSWDG